jgi:phospho-N-acetylmuramoyl-pentapeptide-transferase
LNVVTELASAAFVSFAVTAVLGFVAVPALKRLKYGQTILDIGPVWHKEKKQGIPTMGGIMFIAGTIAGFTAGIVMLYRSGEINFSGVGGAEFFRAVSGILMSVCFGFVGFLDDYIKVKKKQNQGLTSNQKVIMQVMIIAAFFTSRYVSGVTSTIIKFPFLGQLNLHQFYYVVVGLAILYLVNAVNLTDGVDGLCSSVTRVYCATFLVICGILGYNELSVLSVAAAGGCLGFLVWNYHPAKVFMGDTGSMFLGGMVCALGIGAGTEVLMVIAAAVFIWEAVTVIIQVAYFKITGGKRLFKMTPIHHAFEMRGWKETKIVAVFSAIAAICGAAAIVLTSGL